MYIHICMKFNNFNSRLLNYRTKIKIKDICVPIDLCCVFLKYIANIYVFTKLKVYNKFSHMCRK